MSQYKVIKASRNHEFKVGEIVTRAPNDSVEFQFFETMAEMLGMKEHPLFAACAPYTNSAGRTQVLEPTEVVAL